MLPSILLVVIACTFLFGVSTAFEIASFLLGRCLDCFKHVTTFVLKGTPNEKSLLCTTRQYILGVISLSLHDFFEPLK